MNVLWLGLPPSANLDEIFTFILSLVGISLISGLLYGRIRDVRHATTRTGRIVAVGRIYTNGFIAFAHLVLLTQAIRLTQERVPGQPPLTLLTAYLIPLIPLALIGASVVEIVIRRAVNRADTDYPRPPH